VDDGLGHAAILTVSVRSRQLNAMSSPQCDIDQSAAMLAMTSAKMGLQFSSLPKFDQTKLENRKWAKGASREGNQKIMHWPGA
jgi:hypothetical protein